MSFDSYFMGDCRRMRGRCFPFCLRQHKSVSWRWTRTRKNKTVISSYKISTLSIWCFLAVSRPVKERVAVYHSVDSRNADAVVRPLQRYLWAAGLWLAQGLAEEQWQRVGLSARSCLGSTHQQAPRWQTLREMVFLAFLPVEIRR